MASIDAQLENVLGSASALDPGTSIASSPSVSRSSSLRTSSRSEGRPSDALLKLGGHGSGIAGGVKPVDSLNAVQEEAVMTPRTKKRFSAMGGRSAHGGKDEFDEIDGRITAQSQSVSDKVSAIQLKVSLSLRGGEAVRGRD